jgi:hypothetical protein
MKQWRRKGKRLILCLDANMNIYMGELGQQLAYLHGLGMKEVVGEFTARKLGATYFQGSVPIDAIWATSDVTVANGCVMPAGYGVGDYRLLIVNFATLLVGTSCVQKIIQPALCCLNTRIEGCTQRYNKAQKRNILRHCLLEQMVNATLSNESKEVISKQLNQLDKEGEEYMKHAEKKCWRLKLGRIPFSPEAALWIRQSHVYRSLLRWHDGKIQNQGNLQRTSRQCQIKAPFQLSVEDIKLRLWICKGKCNYF